eukprot:1159970-Pelagomonas_calceolata.AAC.2
MDHAGTRLSDWDMQAGAVALLASRAAMAPTGKQVGSPHVSYRRQMREGKKWQTGLSEARNCLFSACSAQRCSVTGRY